MSGVRCASLLGARIARMIITCPQHANAKPRLSLSSQIALTQPAITPQFKFKRTKMVPPAKPSSTQAEVVLVGCGAPGRGMGWYHAIQMLGNRCPSAKLCHIVEPWFLGPGADGPGGKEFAEFKADAESSCGVLFHSSVAALPPVAESVKRLVLISGRTADNPRIMSEAIKAGCHCVYLEKPGAPTVAELAVMKSEAAAANVSVWMGYNKNVCKYVSKTRDFAAGIEDGHVTFVSNNTYSPTPESLGECFERNSEGMLKNMAIHELALLVSFYDVTVENIDSVVADASFSSMQTLSGPSGRLFTDFDKIKFTIKTKSGKEVSVQADRCGGNDSYAKVTNSAGEELFRHSMPDEEDKENVAVLEAAFPGAMPYFFSQDPDYATLKERVAAFCATGAEPTGVASIDIAYETLRVAEHLVPLLQEQLKGCASA